MDESGLSMPLPLGGINYSPEPALISDSGEWALQRLVSRGVPQDELLSLIEKIVTNMKAGDVVECLRGSGAQIFIDVIDEACR